MMIWIEQLWVCFRRRASYTWWETWESRYHFFLFFLSDGLASTWFFVIRDTTVLFIAVLTLHWKPVVMPTSVSYRIIPGLVAGNVMLYFNKLLSESRMMFLSLGWSPTVCYCVLTVSPSWRQAVSVCLSDCRTSSDGSHSSVSGILYVSNTLVVVTVFGNKGCSVKPASAFNASEITV